MKLLKNQIEKDKLIVISTGDPAGIGTEIILKALGSKDLPPNLKALLVGCKENITKTYDQLKALGIQNIANINSLDIINIPFKGNIKMGEPTKETGSASFDYLTKAIRILLNNQARALVTAPIAKHAWHSAGHIYAGQTELLGELTKVKNPSMLFTAISPHNGWRLNTLLATTHIPLSKVISSINKELIHNKLDVLLTFCNQFKSNPIIKIAGLNPHSGENGKIGKQEITLINPAINEWKNNHPNIKVIGPTPPDSCWIEAANAWITKPKKETPDGFLALYHDQGLIPVKIIAFESAVNTTLGLPFIRTSPDHGTAFDIAGKGIARHESMLAAINSAWTLSKNNY